ncbi:hypothetical protein F5Y12DRAFT_716040 [Xylaria sp. FL1777]|nr:hypothetical protein F5Y12DRAFT_716040 [Xylaria sp. FL1777]
MVESIIEAMPDAPADRHYADASGGTVTPDTSATGVKLPTSDSEAGTLAAGRTTLGEGTNRLGNTMTIWYKVNLLEALFSVDMCDYCVIFGSGVSDDIALVVDDTLSLLEKSGEMKDEDVTEQLHVEDFQVTIEHPTVDIIWTGGEEDYDNDNDDDDEATDIDFDVGRTLRTTMHGLSLEIRRSVRYWTTSAWNWEKKVYRRLRNASVGGPSADRQEQDDDLD